MSLSFTIAAKTDIGRLRKNNEDSCAYFVHGGRCCYGGSVREYRDRLGVKTQTDGPDTAARGTGAESEAVLAVVCDGMGGVEGGEVASGMIVDQIGKWFRGLDHQMATRPNEAALHEIAIASDREVWMAASADPVRKGMGATLSTIWLSGNRYAVVQVGDSRIYRWRSGELVQLTEDQSVIARMERESGRPVPSSVAFQYKGMLEQAVGSTPGMLKPVTSSGEVLEGDLFLLCSDGMFDAYDNEPLSAFLKRKAGRTDLPELAEKLVCSAVERSGRDNTTAVFVAAGVVPASGSFFSRFFR